MIATAIAELRSALSGPAGKVFAVALVLPLVAVAIDLTDRIWIDGKLTSFDGEWGIPTVISGLAFALGGLAALVAAARRPHERTAWAVIGGLGLLFAAEELALQLHERAEDAFAKAPLLVAEAALGIVLVLVLWRTVARLPRDAKVLLAAAAATLVVAEVSAAVAAAIRGIEAIEQPRILLIEIEEGGEVLVGTWLIAAALPYARRG